MFQILYIKKAKSLALWYPLLVPTTLHVVLWVEGPVTQGGGGGGGVLLGGGGGHSGTEWLPTAKRPRRAGAVNSLEAKKGGGQLQTKHLTRIVAHKMCLFSLYFLKYMMFITLNGLWNNWSPFVYNLELRKFDFRGQWSATPKNRGRSKKTQGWTGLESEGGSLAVGTYLQRGSAPPPGPVRRKTQPHCQ